MRKLLIAVPVLLAMSTGLAGVASAAQHYPLCSKTVQDECINPSQAHHHHHKAG